MKSPVPIQIIGRGSDLLIYGFNFVVIILYLIREFFNKRQEQKYAKRRKREISRSRSIDTITCPNCGYSQNRTIFDCLNCGANLQVQRKRQEPEVTPILPVKKPVRTTYPIQTPIRKPEELPT